MTEVWGREALISLLAPRGHPQFNHPAFTCSQSHSGSAHVTHITRFYPPLPAYRPGVLPLLPPWAGGLQVVNGSQRAWPPENVSPATISPMLGAF